MRQEKCLLGVNSNPSIQQTHVSIILNNLYNTKKYKYVYFS